MLKVTDARRKIAAPTFSSLGIGATFLSAPPNENLYIKTSAVEATCLWRNSSAKNESAKFVTTGVVTGFNSAASVTVVDVELTFK